MFESEECSDKKMYESEKVYSFKNFFKLEIKIVGSEKCSNLKNGQNSKKSHFKNFRKNLMI
jgi:hypothetical protein